MKFEYHNIEYHNSITELQNAISNGIIEYMNFGGYHTSYDSALEIVQSRSLSLRSSGRNARLWDNPLPEAKNSG